MLVLLGQGSTAIAGAEDHIVSGNLELRAALVDDGDTVVVDFCQQVNMRAYPLDWQVT